MKNKNHELICHIVKQLNLLHVWNWIMFKTIGFSFESETGQYLVSLLSCWFKAAKVLLKSKISIHWYTFLPKKKIFLRRFFLCECCSILKNWHHFPHQIVPDPDAMRKKNFQNNNKTKIHIKLRLKSVG